MMMRSKGIVEDIDNLASDVAQADVRLHNTFNEFMMLADGQFIENRVYEDDDSDSEGEGEEETKESSGEKNVEDVKQVLVAAFQDGIEALKLFYDTVEDTEEEVVEENKIEDIYNIRPLPFIIGTQQFIDSSDAGLGDVPGAKDDGHDDDGNILDHGSDSDEDEEETQLVVRRSDQSDVEEDDVDDEHSDEERSDRDDYEEDMSEGERSQSRSDNEESDDDYERPPVQQRVQIPIIPQKGRTKSVSSGTPSDVSDSDDDYKPPVKIPVESKRVTQPSHDESEEDDDDEDLFGDTQDDPYSLFGAPSASSKKKAKSKSTHDAMAGLFGDDTSGGNDYQGRSDSFASVDSLFDAGGSSRMSKKSNLGGLFGSTNESNLFDDVEKTIEPVDDFDDDDYEPPEDTVKEKVIDSGPKKSGIQAVGASDLFSSGGDLFGGESDSDDDMFGQKTKTAPKPKTEPAVVKKAPRSDLFGDDDDGDDDLFGSKPKSKPESSSKKTAPVVKKAATSDLFGGDDESDDDLFGSKPKPTVQSAAKSNTPIPKKSAAASNLFNDDDDSDDDLLGSKPRVDPLSKSNATKHGSSSGKVASSSDLFGDDDDDSDGLFSSKPKPKPTKVEPKKVEPPIMKPATVGRAKVSSGLFDGDDDGSDDDLFGEKANPRPKTPPSIPAKKSTTSQSSDLFGADDDSDDDMFTSKPKPKDVPAEKIVVPEAKPKPTVFAPPLPKRVPSSSPSSSDSEDDWETGNKATTTVVNPPANLTAVKEESVDKDKIDQVDNTPDESPPPLPPSSSPAVSKRMSGALAKRMSGLDATKIVMPGMTPPPMFGKNRDRSQSSGSGGTRSRTGSSASEPGEIVNVTMERATVSGKKGRSRKAPSRKKVDIPSTDSDPLFSSDVLAPSGQEKSGGIEDSKRNVSSGNAPNLFGDSGPDNDLFGNKSTSNKEPVVQKSTSSKVASAGLFGDGDGSDDDVFSSNITQKQETRPLTTKVAPVEETPVVSKPSSGLFGGDDDNDDDLFGGKAKAKTETKTVAKAASSKGTSSGLFGDDDNGDYDLFGNKISSKPKTETVTKTAVASTKTTSSGLFGNDDDNDDDLFGSKSKPTNQASKSTKAPVSKGSGLFGDDDGSDDDLFGSKPKTKAAPVATKKTASSSLFGDDDGDDDLFGGSSKPKTTTKPKPKASSSGLFGDDDDDDLFGSKSKAGKSGLFD